MKEVGMTQVSNYVNCVDISFIEVLEKKSRWEKDVRYVLKDKLVEE